MHIYRLAIDLGLIDAKYQDSYSRKVGVVERIRADLILLTKLKKDPFQWGQWAKEIHETGIQKVRQYRAYIIKSEEKGSIIQEGEKYRIHDWLTSLEDCQCPDFQERRLPCKHIYAIALEKGISLCLSYEDFLFPKGKDWEDYLTYYPLH